MCAHLYSLSHISAIKNGFILLLFSFIYLFKFFGKMQQQILAIRSSSSPIARLLLRFRAAAASFSTSSLNRSRGGLPRFHSQTLPSSKVSPFLRLFHLGILTNRWRECFDFFDLSIGRGCSSSGRRVLAHGQGAALGTRRQVSFISSHMYYEEKIWVKERGIVFTHLIDCVVIK